jgi:hypothetical protein
MNLDPDAVVLCRDGRRHPARRTNTVERDELIREAISKGLTQRQVGEMVGLSQSQVCRVVRRTDSR